MAGVTLAAPGPLDQPTGGYRYNARLREALAAAGWAATALALPAGLPRPGPGEADAAAKALAARPAGEPAILDGLALGGLPRHVADIAAQRPLVALIHHPLADETGLSAAEAQALDRAEGAGLAACHAVLVPSAFVARRLAARHPAVDPDRVTVAPPGPTLESAPAPAAPPGDSAIRLLCVGSLVPRKGQDLLVAALGRIAPATPWRLELAGAAPDASFNEAVARQAQALGIAERVRFRGALADAALARAYAEADLLVLPSRFEGHGLVVDEALAAGLPVLASDAGALADTANRPGCRQVPADAPAALAAALAELIDAGPTRQALASAAAGLPGPAGAWSDSAAQAGRAVAAARARWLASA